MQVGVFVPICLAALGLSAILMTSQSVITVHQRKSTLFIVRKHNISNRHPWIICFYWESRFMLLLPLTFSVFLIVCPSAQTICIFSHMLK